MHRCFETSGPITSGHQSSVWGGQGSDALPYLSRDPVHGILFCKLDETWKVTSSLLCLAYLKLNVLVIVRRSWDATAWYAGTDVSEDHVSNLIRSYSVVMDPALELYFSANRR
jgi:hypothetical protein